MREIRLSGQLICRDLDEVALVERHLPEHISRTRAESGCLDFDVVQTSDPLVWRVQERFADEAAFRVHQERVRASAWGRATAGIVRDYTIDGLPE